MKNECVECEKPLNAKSSSRCRNCCRNLFERLESLPVKDTYNGYKNRHENVGNVYKKGSNNRFGYKPIQWERDEE